MELEIRCLKQEEYNDMRRMVAISFGVRRPKPQSAPQDHDYQQQTHNYEHTHVCVLDNQIISYLQMIPKKIWIGGRCHEFGGVGGVCTLPEHRKKGYAGRMMQEIINYMFRSGYYLSGLYAVQPAYYRKFGYALLANDLSQCRIGPDNLPAYEEKRWVRNASGDDLVGISKVYEACNQGGSCWVERDAHAWTEIMRRIDRACVFDRGGISAYLLMRSGEEKKEADGVPVRKTVIREAASLSLAATRGLLGFLSGLSGDSESLDYTCGLNDAFGKEIVSYGGKMTIGNTDFMFRLTDVATAMEKAEINAGLGEEEFSIVLSSDPVVKANEGKYLVRTGRGRLVVERTQHATGEPVKVDIEALSEMYCGYRDAARLRSLGRLECSSDRLMEILTVAFPRRFPFMWVMDGF